MKIPFLALAISTLLVGCGGDYKETLPPGTNTTFNGQSVKILSGNVAAGPSLDGTGDVLFSKDYGSATSGGSYAFDFSLADGGSLVLVSHSNAALESGWEMEFRRQGAGAGSLKVTLRANGVSRDTNNSAGQDVFSGFDASQGLKLQVDVHNNESPTHSLTWSRAITEDFAEESAILNTEENDNSPGQGSGTRWGLRLDNAVVTKADAMAPKFQE